LVDTCYYYWSTADRERLYKIYSFRINQVRKQLLHSSVNALDAGIAGCTSASRFLVDLELKGHSRDVRGMIAELTKNGSASVPATAQGGALVSRGAAIASLFRSIRLYRWSFRMLVVGEAAAKEFESADSIPEPYRPLWFERLGTLATDTGIPMPNESMSTPSEVKATENGKSDRT
jgi:hypothetical protein